MRTKSKAAAYFDVPAMNQQAIASQFKEFKTEVADAIRAKKGTTESINPQDFAEEIASIETGGGGNYVYYSGTGDDFVEWLAVASIIKATTDKGILLMPQGDFIISGTKPDNVIGAGFDTSMKLKSFASSFELTTVGDVIAEPSKEWTQITEEEFYRDPNVIQDGYFRVLSDYENTDVILQYDSGMTWRDWINSPYNLNPTTNKPYLSIGFDKYVHWKYSDGYSGSMHNENDSDSSVMIDDLIANKTYYAVIIA